MRGIINFHSSHNLFTNRTHEINSCVFGENFIRRTLRTEKKFDHIICAQIMPVFIFGIQCLLATLAEATVEFVRYIR